MQTTITPTPVTVAIAKTTTTVAAVAIAVKVISNFGNDAPSGSEWACRQEQLYTQLKQCLATHIYDYA